MTSKCKNGTTILSSKKKNPTLRPKETTSSGSVNLKSDTPDAKITVSSLLAYIILSVNATANSIESGAAYHKVLGI